MDEPWRSQYNNNELSKEEIQKASLQYNNVFDSITIVLQAIKENQ